jgi:hypothetical protein
MPPAIRHPAAPGPPPTSRTTAGERPSHRPSASRVAALLLPNDPRAPLPSAEMRYYGGTPPDTTCARTAPCSRSART